MKKVLITLGSVAVLAFTACGGSATQTDASSVSATSSSESATIVSVNDAANETATRVNSYPPIPQIPADN